MITNTETIKRFDIWKKEKGIWMYYGEMPHPKYRIEDDMRNYSFDEIFEVFIKETGIEENNFSLTLKEK